MVLDNGSKVPATVINATNSQNTLTNSLTTGGNSTSTTNSGQSETIPDVTVVSINTDITKIDLTSIELSVSLVTTKNAVEELIKNVGAYSWTYQLSSISNSGIKNISKSVKIGTNPAPLPIDNLVAGTSYSLIITAAGGADNVGYSSQNIIFTTAHKNKDEASIKFGTENLKNRVDKIYVKTSNGFKRAILYTK
jgi:hypothetical protein